ncbi:hypothetical protein MAR_038203 [Mya arenaria]|uniref:Uncharacterized protein n=1 Tax=Mya arenaria TaxID=6604 RepID=A0ABY7FTR4_MYAAR|nr:uncharacterized protein LOC128214324 [Mya arenaria]WAR24534.1 hypothetical protein MAR_038203 [Mya arenaria]
MMLIYFLLWGSVIATHNTENSGTSQTPALPPDEMYQDMFPLTKTNFTDCVLRNMDPWILIFHAGAVERAWKTMATRLRGVCWVGTVDVTKETELVTLLAYDESKGPFRVFPYGDRNRKENHWRNIEDENTARAVCVRSIPDEVLNMEEEEVKDIFMDSFMAKPTRFPVFLLQVEEETSSTFKALAKRFAKYFTFTKLVRPSSKQLKGIGIEQDNLDLPEMFVVITKEGQTNELNAVRFDKQKLGYFNYTNVMEFLFSVNNNYRHELPGDNLAHVRKHAEMIEIVNIEKKRFDIVSAGSSARLTRSKSKDTHTVRNNGDNENKVNYPEIPGLRDEL